MSPRSVGIAARVAGALLGIGLMAAPSIVDVGDLATALARIIGPIQAALCVIAVSGAVTAVRWATVAAGGALVVGAVVVFDAAGSALLGLAGVAAVALGLVPLPAASRFGGGWRQAWRDLRAGSEGGADSEDTSA